jgi:hypothetical protein
MLVSSPVNDAFQRIAFRYANSINFEGMKWRHHGLGMLQGELDEKLRVHVWHPRLVRMDSTSYRRVHDHRFDILSAVILGHVIDVRYVVSTELPIKVLMSRFSRTSMWEIKHAKIQAGVHPGCSTATDATKIGTAWVREESRSSFGAGSVYDIERRKFHTTEVTGLAVTMVYRSNFDDRLARVLGEADADGSISSAMVGGPEPKRMKDLSSDAQTTLTEAKGAIFNIFIAGKY